jgi:hypothetical protein
MKELVTLRKHLFYPLEIDKKGHRTFAISTVGVAHSFWVGFLCFRVERTGCDSTSKSFLPGLVTPC